MGFDMHLKHTLLIFLASFKKLHHFAWVFVYDILFYVFLYAGLVSWVFLSSRLRFEPSAAQDFYIWAEQTAAQGQTFLTALALYTLGFFVFIIIIWAFFKALSWSVVLKKKFSMKLFLQFLKTHLIWCPAWVLASFLFAMLIQTTVEKQIAIFAAGLVVSGYFTTILDYELVLEPKLKTMKTALALGIKKLHYLFVTFATAGVAFFLIMFALWPITNFPSPYNTFFALIIFTLFGAWFKYYFALSVEHIKNA